MLKPPTIRIEATSGMIDPGSESERPAAGHEPAGEKTRSLTHLILLAVSPETIPKPTPVPADPPVIRSIPAPSPKSNAKAPVRRRRTWNSSNARLTRRPERGGGMNLRIDPVNFSAAGGFKASSFMRGASQARRTLDEPPHNPVPFTKAQANRRKSSLGEL